MGAGPGGLAGEVEVGVGWDGGFRLQGRWGRRRWVLVVFFFKLIIFKWIKIYFFGT